MGCGDSKLAVATSNAILRRKKSNAGEATKKSKGIGTIPETTTDSDNSVANPKGQQQQQEKEQQAAGVGNKDNAGVVAADDVKDINENRKESGDDNKVLVVPEHEAGRLITSEESPRDCFSSRKLEDEGIDAIISEGRSGTSDYYTPRHGPGSKGTLFFKADDQESKVLEEDKELLPAFEETKPALDTTSSSKENTGEAAVLVEENLVKETAEVEIKTTTAEAKVSSLTVKEDKKDEKKEEEEEDKKEDKKEGKKEEKSSCECTFT